MAHEQTCHRQAWKCREHPGLTFKEQQDFKNHLQSDHPEWNDRVCDALMEYSRTSLVDDRKQCPICLITVGQLPQSQDIFKHIVNHLERFAAFTIPRNVTISNEDSTQNSDKAVDLVGSRSQDDLPEFSSAGGASNLGEPNGPWAVDDINDQLIHACQTRDATAVHALLWEADSNLQASKYENALEATAGGGSLDIVRILLTKDSYIYSQNENYGSALQTPSRFGYEANVGTQSRPGDDLHDRQGRHDTAIQAAAVNGHLEIVKTIIRHLGDTVRYQSMLREAAANGQTENVQDLLQGWTWDIWPDEDTARSIRGSAFQAAVVSGHTRIAQILLAEGVDENSRNDDGSTALQVAAFNGDEKMVQLLLDNRFDINARGDKYGSALQAAAASDHTEIVQILLENGADINARGSDGTTALQVAASRGNEIAVQLLLNMGADVNARGSDGTTALQVAASRGNENAVQLLLDIGADVNARGGRFGTALQAAIVNGHDEIAQLLRNYEAQEPECLPAETSI